ncbi:MAG: DNA polymerase III subunit epsilon [Corynebacterium pyruviciproducens]|uniref:DNA polymerase III subunit epsilon n=1 Tax=Corynebacterium pyruviciproducens TaxID=598660 RepID=UPI002456A0F2|nr:DNA polymerase III subunit epsilon [Corynebacterium pyruviciproducens]MDH4659095.1 DNA polymerase III subunit epsilon [Corynebacterium pyruviciproducens]MDK6567025.1 DNA polymerase III subunit epsilon [Corynebacterium pyruviciproducens]
MRDPYVALSIQTTGLHPSTARIVTIDAVTFTADGEPVDSFFTVVNPVKDPGPRHLHGVPRAEIEAAKPYGHFLKTLCTLLDGRTLIAHNAPQTWGFIVSESKRTLKARRRKRGGRRRRGVGHVPRPVAVVDTLGAARRESIFVTDTRLRSLAHQLGYDVSENASTSRAAQPAAELTREDTLLVARLYFERFRNTKAVSDPRDLKADRFGLQRSLIRVDAAAAARKDNPGQFQGNLKPGMEVVVAPEIARDPDDIIHAVVDHELAYSEKVTRTTSLVVCNEKIPKRGKGMHAHRKGIPLVTDEEFMRLASMNP